MLVQFVLGSAVVGMIVAWLFRDRLVVRLAGALPVLVCGCSLLVISTTEMRGLAPPSGVPAPGPEPLSLVAGLALVAIAVCLALGVPRRAP